MEDKLYKLTPYVGMTEITKEALRKQFEAFLEDPMLYGQFLVYCAQGRGMYHRMSACEVLANTREWCIKQTQSNYPKED